MSVRWVLVTGAADKLDPHEQEAASAVGAMLAREGYGLIVGDWPGVDQLVAAAFLESLPRPSHASRIRHIKNYWKRGHRVPDAKVLEDDGDDPNYSSSAVVAADAGIIVSGRKGSKPTMDALLRLQKPVLPVAFLGWDSFALFREVLERWEEQPVAGLTERQFLELVRPWRYDTRILARLLKASLTTEPHLFISYRRDDVPTAAGRVFDELAHTYGTQAVFIDYDKLRFGQEVERLLSFIPRCSTVVALVGRNWDPVRLNDPDDYVRRELETAYQAKVQIIPLLVQRSTLPTVDELPESLAFLWDLNFATIRTDDWSGSMEHLRAAVDQALFTPKTAPRA